MGVPFREFCQKDESGIGDKLGESNIAVPSQPVSPGKVINKCSMSVVVLSINFLAHPKDKKVKDSKKGKLPKDSVRVTKLLNNAL